MTSGEIIGTLLSIIGFFGITLIGMTVKYLKAISANLSELNIKIAVLIKDHDGLEKRVEHIEHRLEEQ
jgi:proteasome assembly chaperone (PAC2) family protein